MFQGFAKSKGIGFSLEIDEQMPRILVGDSTRVRQILVNLLSNAIKFTHSGGQVRIYCEAKDDMLLTHVQDTGVGLNEDEIGSAFQGKKLSARPTGGESSTGLGLVIVKKLVERHGGNVWLISHKDVGSTFSFSLPVEEQ